MAPLLGAWADHSGFRFRSSLVNIFQHGKKVLNMKFSFKKMICFFFFFHLKASFTPRSFRLVEWFFESVILRCDWHITLMWKYNPVKQVSDQKWQKFLSWLKQKLEWRRISGDFFCLREHLNVIQIFPFIWERNYPASLQFSCIYISICPKMQSALL